MVQVRTTIEPDVVHEATPRDVENLRGQGLLLEEVDVAAPAEVTNVDAKEHHDQVQQERREALEQDKDKTKGQAQDKSPAKTKTKE